MTWLAPLGFLGLIGLIILIIIYIIKPNYQQKFISSTYVWKLSLKYRKKRIPLSKLRNILLFICQVLILTGATCILAQPFLDMDNSKTEGDTILIIDASASMQADLNEETRLQRAVDQALADANEALNNGRTVSVILASDKASYLVQQAGKEQAQLVYEALDVLTTSPEAYSTFGTPDIEGAMKLAEQITSYARNASVTLYTDTTYLNSDKVTVYNVNDTAEWNAAILDVRATIVENYYRIEIDVASYGADARMDVTCEIFDANDTGTSVEVIHEVYCSGDQITTVVLGHLSEDMPESEADLIDEDISIFAYDHMYVHLSEYDSLDQDNRFYLYGGKKPTLKIMYYSTMPNNYWPSALLVLQDILRDRWSVEITEVLPGSEVPIDGFDVYIYEHEAPNTVPSDGIVIYSDPKELPAEAGVRLGSQAGANGSELFLSAGDPHEVMRNVDPSRISVTQFTTVASTDGYVPLICYDTYPLVLLKEDVDQKIMLMPFSMHYSNLAVVPDFPLLVKNIVEYFFPVTLEGHKYEVNDTIGLNARADVLDVTGPDMEVSLETFPAELLVTLPGTYTMTQIPMSGDPVIENVYVKIPAEESNINLVESTLTNPYFFEESDSADVDLLFYFALAVVALLFFEWWLKSREQI